MSKASLLAPKPIANLIFLVRGKKVLLDADLAALYGVEVRALNQAVRRNERRFPKDFVFQLTARENRVLRSQIVISETDAADAGTCLMRSQNTGPLWLQPFLTRRVQCK